MGASSSIKPSAIVASTSEDPDGVKNKNPRDVAIGHIVERLEPSAQARKDELIAIDKENGRDTLSKSGKRRKPKVDMRDDDQA